MNFRSPLLLAATLFIASFTKAQTIENCVALLSSKASEITGQIKILNGNRFLVRDANFNFKNGAASILWDTDKKNRTVTEFYPGEIDRVEIPDFNKSSPIGTIVIYFKDAVVKSENLATEVRKYQQKSYFNYIQKDPKNAELIKSTLLQLKKLCTEKYPSTSLWNSFAFLASDQPVWTSKKSVSYTYKIKKIEYSGCSIRLLYNLEVVSLTGTTNDNYMAIVPLNNIEKIVYDAKASRPASYWVEGDNDFEILKLNTAGEYVQFGKQDRVLLAGIDAEKGEATLRPALEAALKEAAKCGQSKPFKFGKE